jgi:hypothetical protein
MVALVAAVCGCASNQYPSETSRQPIGSVSPSAPDVAASPAPSVRPSAQLSPSVAHAIEHVLKQTSDHPRAAVLDFSAHSTTPRFHVIDGYAEFFSNVLGSNASSLGLYRTAEIYRSDVYPGLAMRLDGLSSTNSNARSRFIVVHEARYMESRSWKGKKMGRPGLSDGCFVFSKDDRDAVISNLQGGALIYAIYEKP